MGGLAVGPSKAGAQVQDALLFSGRSDAAATSFPPLRGDDGAQLRNLAPIAASPTSAADFAGATHASPPSASPC